MNGEPSVDGRDDVPNGEEHEPPKESKNIDSNGLTSAQVEDLRAQWGFNEVVPREVPEWKVFLSRYLGIIPLIMLITAIIAVSVEQDGSRDWMSFGLLIFEINLVAMVGHYSERNSGNAIKELQRLAAPFCKARRDGGWVNLPVRELVPGDTIALHGGDVIPADATLVGEGEPLQVDESSLTGEALAVTKRPGDEVLSGAVVVQGEMEAVVNKTGAHTFFGKTISLLSMNTTEGHLNKLLRTVGNAITVLGAVTVVAIFFVLLFRDDFGVNIAVKTAFTILVAVVPVGMPVVTATMLAVGAKELAREKAIVSRLSAIEEMAGMEALCSDKTGTLTKNKLTLDAQLLRAFNDYTHDEVLRVAALASKWENMDAVDKAVTGVFGDRSALSDYKVKRFIPFNPVEKKTVATVELPSGESVLMSKGAPHVINDMCLNAGGTKAGADAYILEMAERGLRTLGVALSSDDGLTWELVGMLPLLDPPRDDTLDTIRRAQDLGIEVKMITGDQRAIAVETARRLGMGTNIMGKDVWGKGLSDAALGDLVESVNGFAGVYPEHKYKIVESLQMRGKLIGMTGDGVNDAPALKRANVGIAVAGATDAARGAADIILTEEGLSTIITGIVRSRKIFRRLTSYISYRIASSVLILFFFFFSIIVLEFEMLLSLVNDFTVMSTALDKVHSSNKPDIFRMGKVMVVACTVGAVQVAAAFLLLYLSTAQNGNWWHIWGINLEFDTAEPGYVDAKVVAVMFLYLNLAIQLNIFSCRNPSFFWYISRKTAPRPSLVVVAPVFSSILLVLFLCVYWPRGARLGGGAHMEGCGWAAAGVTVLYAFVWFTIADLFKVAAVLLADVDTTLLYSGEIFAGVLSRSERAQKLKEAQRDNARRLDEMRHDKPVEHENRMAILGAPEESPRSHTVDTRLLLLERQNAALMEMLRAVMEKLDIPATALQDVIQTAHHGHTSAAAGTRGHTGLVHRRPLLDGVAGSEIATEQCSASR
eukprot:jgi/Mesvir1/8845/Mv02741-RA.1